MQNQIDQVGGNIILDVRDLAVPFAFYLASLGLRKNAQKKAAKKTTGQQRGGNPNASSIGGCGCNKKVGGASTEPILPTGNMHLHEMVGGMNATLERLIAKLR